MHQAHQPRTVANMLHTMRSCILLQGWDGGSAQAAKALRLAFDMCTLSAQVGLVCPEWARAASPSSFALCRPDITARVANDLAIYL